MWMLELIIYTDVVGRRQLHTYGLEGCLRSPSIPEIELYCCYLLIICKTFHLYHGTSEEKLLKIVSGVILYFLHNISVIMSFVSLLSYTIKDFTRLYFKSQDIDKFSFQIWPHYLLQIFVSLNYQYIYQIKT